MALVLIFSRPKSIVTSVFLDSKAFQKENWQERLKEPKEFTLLYWYCKMTKMSQVNILIHDQ